MNNNQNNKNSDNMFFSANNNIDKKIISEAAKSGNTDKLINSLSPEDKQKLNSILNDKKAIAEVLKSPQAAAILKMLSGGGKNG
ncbi:MAG: hypothetical protein J6D52_00525 [Clostridia bacterium]|nr:hypothetical protein [Clostridia bacterium]